MPDSTTRDMDADLAGLLNLLVANRSSTSEDDSCFLNCCDAIVAAAARPGLGSCPSADRFGRLLHVL